MIDQQEANRRVKLWEQGYWEIPESIDTADFDFSWRPHKFDRPYIHQFGTQWQKTGGPRFVIPENEGIKYQHHMIAKRLPEPEKFNVLIEQFDVDFDFSWHPDDTEPPFIWTFGNQFKNTFEMPTLEYCVEGATERKHVTDLIAKLQAKKEYWKVLLPIENYGWDKTWCPDIYDPPYIYVWGNQWNSGEVEPTLEYRVPGATEKKYMNNFTPRVKKDKTNWNILIPVDESNFDFSWRPNPYDPPMIYVWGNQWNNATIEPTIEYCPPTALQQQYFRPVERKYMNDRVAPVVADMCNWEVMIPLAINGFDFSWRPNPYDPPMIYVWGNQWHPAEIEPTVKYEVPGATQIKYMNDRVATVSVDMTNWKMIIPCDFDFSWRPDPYDPPFIYVWGNQWHDYTVEPTLEYHVPGATEKKYMNDKVAMVIPDMSKWNVLIPIDETSFDFSWRPSPREPDMIYVWGNQWNDSMTEPTIEYIMPSATERKYMTDVVAKVLPDMSKWKISDSSGYKNFDFSWRPNPHSPAQIYQWEDGGPIYTVENATEIVFMEKPHFDEDVDTNIVIPKYYIETTLDELVEQHPNEVFWALNPDLNYDKFDFSWKPNDKNFRHINVFGNKVSKDLHTYYINAPLYTSGYKEINYVEDWEVEIVTDIDMFYILKGNEAGVGRFEELKKRYPRLQKTRYLNSWVDTINRCLRKTTTKFAWFLSSEVDYSDFKFDYYPASWNRDKIHVFGNQWTHWGNTYLINKDTFEKDTQYVKVIEHLPTINHVRNKKTKLSEYLFDLIYIDHGNDNPTLSRLKSIVSEERLYVVKFDTDYFTTLSNLFKEIPDYLMNEQMTWICSSLCDYSKFDFSWTPDPFIKQKVHIFTTKINGVKQNFGDTFLVDIVEFRYQHTGIENLESYPHGLNKISYLNAERLPDCTEVVTVSEKVLDN